MSDNQAACAHLHIEYDPEEHPDGTRSARWRCRDCQTKFEPKPDLDDFKCLTPLTDAPDEWIDQSGSAGGKPILQSARQSSCFSEDGGKTYYDLDDPENIAKRDANGLVTHIPFAQWKRHKTVKAAGG
jgi:hypothetical protein